jgi:hypothetical protein
MPCVRSGAQPSAVLNAITRTGLYIARKVSLTVFQRTRGREKEACGVSDVHFRVASQIKVDAAGGRTARWKKSARPKARAR